MSQNPSNKAPAKRSEFELPFVPAIFPPRLPKDADSAPIPSQAECEALWDKYSMLPNIRDHSRQVALVVACLGARLESIGMRVNRPLILAGALLHDLAKSYTIKYGGSHTQLGAGWVVQESGNYRLAQMIYHHAYWPWEMDMDNESMLPALLLLYADKRVKHDRIVGLDERFEDLMKRYGVNEVARSLITFSHKQGRIFENLLSERLGVAIDEYSFDCRRLV